MANMIELAVLPVHERLAELHLIILKRPWTEEEEEAFEECMQVNSDVIHELNKIKEMSALAYKSDDTEWQHDICARIEAVSKKFIRGGIYSG
ncbi:hypothetical protein MKY86_28955 [Paenibacillus sp. FSL R7-0333]|uniref:DUF7667 family protein n=2 Tax=Paenibacillus sp. FSL R7-0333 TaxID=1926587 RepID=UPI0009F8EF14